MPSILGRLLLTEGGLGALKPPNNGVPEADVLASPDSSPLFILSKQSENGRLKLRDHEETKATALSDDYFKLYL